MTLKGRTQGPRFDIQSFLRLYPERSLEDIARTSGLSYQYIRHSVKRGLSVYYADQLAITHNSHPCMIWDNWFTA